MTTDQQTSIFDPPANVHGEHDNLTYSAVIQQRNPPKPPPSERPFGKQAQAVYEVMKDGRWRTLEVITHEAGYPPSSIPAINARIREFPRKGILYEKRTAGESRVFEYRLIPATRIDSDSSDGTIG